MVQRIEFPYRFLLSMSARAVGSLNTTDQPLAGGHPESLDIDNKTIFSSTDRMTLPILVDDQWIRLVGRLPNGNGLTELFRYNLGTMGYLSKFVFF